MAKMLWELIEERGGKSEVTLYSSGAAAIEDFAQSPHRARLIPVQIRMTAETKALAAKGESHLVTLVPGAIQHLEHGAGEFPRSTDVERLALLLEALRRKEDETPDDSNG